MRLQLPTWLSWYKKPEYRDIRTYADEINTGRRAMSPAGRTNISIPSRLRLDRILQNKTCSPMSLYDFYMYLKFIEHSAENLEFYMWFKNYEDAYSRGMAVVGEKNLRSTGSVESVSSESTLKKPAVSNTDEDDDEDPEVAKETLARITQLISTDAICSSKSSCSPAMNPANFEAAAAAATSKLLRPAGPITRSELDTVIDLFLRPGAEKELNIPPALRQQAIADLQTSSHPSALKPVADHVYGLLRNCSHRNFVRLGVGNGTFETLCVATMLGIVCTVAGFIVVFSRAFAPYRGAHTRWEVFAAWPLWWLGLSLILSGLRGSCFFLLLFSQRQLLPWERFEEKAAPTSGMGQWTIVRKISRLMIFDRRLKVKERHLRRLQRKIVLQSILGGAMFATSGVMLFVFLPIWRENM